MAGQDVTKTVVIAQLNDISRALYADREARIQRYSCVCHTLAALPVLSEPLARKADEHAPYEVLARGIKLLHTNLVELADHANRAS